MDELSRSLRQPVSRLLGALPERVQMVVNPRKYGFRASDVPPPISVPSGDVRLLIAPVNFAGQAYRWARAARLLPGVGAVNMQYRSASGGFAFPSDYAMPVEVFARSRRWARRQFEAVSTGFTHVLIEAERPIFGSLFGSDVAEEARALRAAGVRVGMIAHGSDIRVPSVHRASHRWSPFHGDEWDLTDRLETQARKNVAILRELDLPIFVSTATLEQYVPSATWLPVVVDPARWSTATPALRRETPVVVHAPSRDVVKGTEFVRAAVADLVEQGRIEYREVVDVPSSEMPGVFADADIVIDAVRMGNYGVGATEAMAAGRLVIVHLDDEARREARLHDTEPPIVDADPATLAGVLDDIVARPAAYRELADAGPEFVRRVHDGHRSAEALRPFLLESEQPVGRPRGSEEAVER